MAELQCVNTSNFPHLLRQWGISLVVTTYQAGKVILLRADGDTLNAHFRQFQRPMGLDINPTRMAVGTSGAVVELYNMPALGQKIEPLGKHDACYVPRNIHYTGDIDIHELAWGAEGLWVVNTAFSCLCTLDPAYSFSPQWWPPFISALSPDDRCHLNGLAMVHDRPRYVTTLGTTDTPQGWRANRIQGGAVVDVATGKLVCQGLSMPHSPRWYGDRLWILESGQGTLSQVDLQTGRAIAVAHLPGFTRGLAFYGRFAFVGLSHVRESKIFGGLPLEKRLEEVTCGVWVVDWMTGEIVAFLRFESGVEEVFAVAVLPQVRFPELLEETDDRIASSFALPDEALSWVAFPAPAPPDAAPPEPDPLQGAE